MSGNPILTVLHAGYGETPECPYARFKPGDVVKVRRLKCLRHLPDRAAIALVVPPGVPPQYALADARKEPRPLTITSSSRAVRYIVGFDGNPTPHLLRESYLLPSGEPSVAIGWTDSGSEVQP